MRHWMEIARRRGESLPDRDALISVLDQQRWLSRRPEDPAYDPRLVSLLFALGTLDMVEKPPKDRSFEGPWLGIRLATGTADEEFEPVLRQLVGLAQELDMTLFLNDEAVSAVTLAAAVTDLQRAGTTLRTLLGRPLSDLVEDPEGWQAWRDAIERAERAGEAAYNRHLETIGPPPPLSEREALLVYFSRSIEDILLSVRTYNCLTNAGVRTLGDLVQKTEAELRTLRNFGRKPLYEIQHLLDRLHLRLGMRL